MDWQAWRKALELYVYTPELIYASIFVAIAIFGFAWWLRSHLSYVAIFPKTELRHSMSVCDLERRVKSTSKTNWTR
jgi:hypothetical protein